MLNINICCFSSGSVKNSDEFLIGSIKNSNHIQTDRQILLVQKPNSESILRRTAQNLSLIAIN